MGLIVQKFGGSSVRDRDRIFNVARIVADTHRAGNDVVVVVSAQGDTTDDLIAKAAETVEKSMIYLISQCRLASPARHPAGHRTVLLGFCGAHPTTTAGAP